MSLVRLDPPADGQANMALDRALLALAEGGRLGARVYTWSEPWVSLGRFQKPDVALVPGCQVPHVVRPTGGKAVLHGHDVTVGLAAPLSALGLPDGSRRLRDVYRAVVRPLVAALRDCGVSASLAEDTPFVRSSGRVADCFAHVSPNDIVGPDARKVCGCALRLSSSAVLVQASIPAGPPLVLPSDVFVGDSAEAWSVGLAPVAFAEALGNRLEEIA